MSEHIESILSNILDKKIRELGFDSLRKFHLAHKESIGVSYELLRQIMRSGRIPRIESIVPILRAVNLSQVATDSLLSRLYPHYRGTRSSLSAASTDLTEFSGSLLPETAESPESDLPRRLFDALRRIPVRGNEDLWEMTTRLAEIAERKVRDRARGRIDQPSLFGEEPESIYQFLVRCGKAVPFMSRGEDCHLEFCREIDYEDRYRGVLLGQAIGAAMGRITQGISAKDIEGLYGRVLMPPIPAGNAHPYNLAIAEYLVETKQSSQEAYATVVATEIRLQEASEWEAAYSENLLDRRYPWFEAGESFPESAAAARCIPLALRHGGDFRRLKLECGLGAATTHPHPAAIAGAILLAGSIARLLHTVPGSLDAIPFLRSSAPFIGGIETDRSGGRNRTLSTFVRRVGTELPALLLRRAPIDEIAKSVGNGELPTEGIPFALGCVLSYPNDFREGVLAAVNAGQDAIRTGAMAGALAGALLGASSIPEGWISRLPARQRLESAAEGLLLMALQSRK